MTYPRPEKGSYWRLLHREGDIPSGSIGEVIDPCDEAGEGEVILGVWTDHEPPKVEQIAFNLGEFNERCQQPAPEPSIADLSTAHEILGQEAIELAQDIWCRDNRMDRRYATHGSARAMLLAAYPELRKKILTDLQVKVEKEAANLEQSAQVEKEDGEKGLASRAYKHGAERMQAVVKTLRGEQNRG